ncbi:MAG TPA: transposase [Xanthobacteraceae bacterium]
MIRLTDEQWERIQNHFPEEHIPDGRPARRPIATRHVLEAELWILNTGAHWHMLPQSYANYKTVHRRFQTWCRDEVLRRVLMDVANELRDRGALDEEDCFIDATFVIDRRRLSRYMRRWLVERFFAWIQWQHRILVRWEYHAQNFLGFVQLACLIVLFRRF